MKAKSKTIISTAAVVAWMCVIYWFSAQNGEQSGAMSGGLLHWLMSFLGVEPDTLQANLLHTILRKGAHFTEYLILSVLVMNLCGQLGYRKAGRILVAVIAAALYACTDEWHQSFVGGRHMSIIDVGIDTCGAVTGAVIYHLLSRLEVKRNGYDL